MEEHQLRALRSGTQPGDSRFDLLQPAVTENPAGVFIGSEYVAGMILHTCRSAAAETQLAIFAGHALFIMCQHLAGAGVDELHVF